MKYYEERGWHVTGRATTPTCSAVQHFMTEKRADGYTGWEAIAYLRRIYAIYLSQSPKILCFDDSDRIHDFDLSNYSYTYAGGYTSHEQSLVARPNNGYIDTSKFSYGG